MPSLAAKNSASLSGPAPVLPWVPDTTAAVALRLLDLDASVAYMLEQKLGFRKDKEAAELIVSSFSIFDIYSINMSIPHGHASHVNN